MQAGAVQDGTIREVALRPLEPAGRRFWLLAGALAGLVAEWQPPFRPEWVTSVPDSGGLVKDLAQRLATALGLEYLSAVEKIKVAQPQKEMQNSTQQVTNLLGAFGVGIVRSGPVLLVDDMVDSRWTLTTVGDLLRAAGSGPVYPLALADTSRSDS